jgi:hypothetical protein
MFDDSFERSEVYFTTLQLLRIFGKWIRDTGRHLRKIAYFDDREGPWVGVDNLKILNDNWKAILEHYDKNAESLLQRTADKTAEVQSLRDGVS